MFPYNPSQWISWWAVAVSAAVCLEARGLNKPDYHLKVRMAHLRVLEEENSQVLGMKDGCTAEHTGLTDKLGFSVQIPPELHQLWLSSQLPAFFFRNRLRRAFPTWTITSGCCPLGGTDKIKAN